MLSEPDAPTYEGYKHELRSNISIATDFIGTQAKTNISQMTYDFNSMMKTTTTPCYRSY